MRVTVPVSRADIALIPQYIQVVKHLECGQNHDLHIVCPQTIGEAAQQMASELDGQFLSTQVHLMELDPMGGWPFAPNVFFYHCAKFMSEDNPNAPWLLNELDCLPIRQNSYDVIAAHAMNSGKPFFGQVGETPGRDLNSGKIMGAPWGKNDVMMSGCAVYPGNIMFLQGFVEKNNSGMMADFMQGENSTDEPWDIHLRALMKAHGMGHTDLIVSMWNTINYRVEEGQMVCDPRMEHEAIQGREGWEVRKCGGKVNPQATLIHGCKDSSLVQLILSDQIPEVIVPRRTKDVPQTNAPAVPQGNFVTQEQLHNFGNDLVAKLASMMGGKSEPAPAPKPPKPEPSPESFSGSDEEKVVQCLTRAAKSLRLDQVATQTGVAPNKIISIAGAQASPFSVGAKPVRWMKLTPQTVS